jgi:hypothetical protein
MTPSAFSGPFGLILLILALFFSLLLILAPYYIYVCAQELSKLRKLGQKILEELNRR